MVKERVLRGSEGTVPGRVGSRGEADAPSDREGRPSTAQAYWRYAEPGAGSPTKGWRCRPSRRRRSPKGLPFLLRQAIPGLRRAGSALSCAAYLPYASALAPALARLASGLACLATKPFRGPAPRSRFVALLAPYCCEYASVARLAGAAHRRSRCDTVFMKRSTEPVARRSKGSLLGGRSTIYKLRALRDF